METKLYGVPSVFDRLVKFVLCVDVDDVHDIDV